MACLFNADLNNNGQDKKSLTHETFISLYGTDPNGIQQANAAYLDMFSPKFKQNLGLDFETVQKDFRNNYLGKDTEGTFVYNESILNEQLEPQLHINKYGQAWFEREDGSKYYTEGKPLSNIGGSYLNESMVKEIVDFTMYNALGGLENLINIDFENEIDFVLDRVLGKDKEFRKWLENQGFAERDIEELIKRVRAQMNMRGLKLKDNDDLAEQQTDEATEDQEFESESEELDNKVETGNQVVKIESYLKNSKDTASANVKILLSFVPKLEAWSKVQLADGSTDYDLELAEGQLGTVIFEDPNAIWTDLEAVLSNIFTINDGGNFLSAVDQMKSQIAELAKDKPSIGFILKYLNDAEKSDQTYKITQFVQAFTKKKLVFYTTEIEGNKPGEYKYKMFDAASATSVQASLRNTWSNSLESIASDTTIFGKTKTGFKINSDVLKSKRKAVGDIKTRLQKKGETITSDDKAVITDFMNNVGIFPSERGMSKVLREIHEETLPGEEFNETKAYKTLIQGELGEIAVLFDKGFKDITSKDGSFINPFKSNKLTQRVAKAETTFQSGFSESTVMLPGSKMAWSYTLPSYIDLRLNEIINNKTVRDSLRALPYNKRSVWLNELENNPQLASEIKSAVFAAIQQKDKSARGDDNKSINKLDQLADQINKSLKALLPNEKSIAYTPAPADKGRFINISGFSMKRLPLTFNEASFSVDANSEGVEILTGYFEDELDRMMSVWNDIKSPNSKKYVHYHLKKSEDEEGNFKWESERNGIPTGNGFQSQLFPELSASSHEQMVTVNDMLGFILYDTDKDSESYAKPIGITAENKPKIKRYIASTVLNKIKNRVADLEKEGVFKRNDKNNLVNNVIDSRIFKHYIKETGGYKRAIYQSVADYLLNGYISNTEYSKIFSGDPAFYKDSVDYNKRIPATYTDGKTLVGITNQKDVHFKIAVINGVEIAARSVEEIKNNFEQSLKEQRKLITDENLLSKLTDDDIKKMADAFGEQYNNVNTTDAQAWITLDRWKFLKTNLDGWSPALESAYQRMKSGTFTVEDMKHAAQPLKGVYFNQDHKNGVPTYLKYSQAILIPSLTKNTQMDKVREAMEKQGIDELITLDGVKAGALETTVIHDQNGNVTEDLSFNIQTLDNLKWKLQQQLPVKGLKESADLGSQMQKNIISNLFAEGVYGQLNGENLTGQRAIEIVDEITSKLTQMGFEDALNTLGTDKDGKIINKEKFYDSLIRKAREDEMPSNIIESLERGYSLDAIPQLRYKSQNIISSTVNKSVAKTVTPGGALIQVANFGIGRIGVDKKDIQDGGIYMLKDIGSLKRPEMVEKTYKDKDGKEVKKTIVKPGQVFLPHKFVQKYIPDYDKLSREELLKRIDKKLLTVIGYRIPNQKLSSNQPLEIVGILGPEMGDSIVMYTEITLQTGSDFDIDKTYVMLPSSEFNQETGKLEYVKPTKNPKSKEQLQNTLYEVYWQILTSPISYFDMMSGIDGSQLKDTIDKLHGKKEKLASLELVDPYYQMSVKFDNMTGKTGVGLTANQMVDHVYTQMYKMSMRYSLGIGNKTDSGDVDLSGIFDTSGKKITDSISMFLNAFVDIAKDPYITKANFNTVTSNMSFLMLRSGVPLDFVIKYIGQPAFKRVVKKVIDNQSKLGDSRRSDFKQFVKDVQSELRRESVRVSATEGFGTRMQTAEETNSDIRNVKAEDLERYITEERKYREAGNTADASLYMGAEYYGAQIGLLETLSELYDPSEQLAGQVLISKADVNGGGPDIVSHFTGMERFAKVMYENTFEGLDRKFGEGTILGSKTEKSLEFLSKFDEENFITMNESFKNVYRTLSRSIKNLDYAIDKNIVKEVERGAYASMVSSSLEGTAYAYRQSDVQNMFFGNNTTHDKVNKAKQNPATKNNPLVKAFDTRVGKDSIKYITLDNFLQRPSSSNEDLTNSWDELFETDRALAIELVRYSIASSGFAKNRHSFHDLLPIRVSDRINNGMDRIKFRGEIEQAVFENFMDDFLRHERNPDQKVTPSISSKRFQELKKNVRIENVGNIKKMLPDLFNGIGTVLANDVMLISTKLEGDNFNVMSDLDMLESNRIIKIGDDLYLNHGVLTLEMMDMNKNTVYVKRRMLTKTHKLGYYNNGTYIYEYGQASVSSDPMMNKSSMDRNNPSNYEGIKTLVQRIKEDEITMDMTPFSYKEFNRTHSDTRRKGDDSTDLENDGTMEIIC